MAELSSSVVPRASKMRSAFGLLSPVKVLEKPLRSARVGGWQPCGAPCSPLPAQPYLHLPSSCRSWGCGRCEGLAQGCGETQGVRAARTPRGKRRRGAGGVQTPRGRWEKAGSTQASKGAQRRGKAQSDRALRAPLARPRAHSLTRPLCSSVLAPPAPTAPCPARAPPPVAAFLPAAVASGPARPSSLLVAVTPAPRHSAPPLPDWLL